ncbi:hypothetical protein BGZ49_009529 [Haplosporangium sp. Z 27]|nr:hypothetical protein BGZ49_009529 [Haplosporangium sp. Z 27]
MDGFIKKPSEAGKSDSTKFTFMDPTPLSSEAIGIPGLIGKARLLLDISKSQGITKQAYLADPSVIYFRSDKSDRGWGCGYRNIQMMLSYVIGQTAVDQDETRVTTQFASVSNPVPTITEIQQQIEFAWENGFDAPGAQQLDHKVTDTGKWIGTTEVWSVLSSLGIRCNILDFHTPTGPKGSHPAMLSAIYNYFRKPAWSPLEAPQKLSFQDYTQFDCDQKIIQTSKPPLYIQHQGHSRTVIGIEVLTTGELNLLVFDPGRWLHKAIPTLKEESVSKIVTPSSGSKITTAQGLFDPQYLLKAFRVSPDWGLSKSQYQLLGISGLYNDSYDESRQNQKNRLDLFKKKASLSIGWNEEEAHQSTTDPLSSSAAASEAAQGHKVFTVRPITSWIDKLAQSHGSPASVSSLTDPNKKYEPRALVLKTMQDSYTEIILPFGKDKALLEEYINFGGHVRHGKIMEDLDALAGAIAYKHCYDGKPNSRPIIIVTAAVDRIDFLRPFGVRDLRLSGHVTYAGFSSLEVFMKMEEISDKDEKAETILAARFTTVARYADTNKAAQVNPLRLQNDAEKKLFQASEDHKTRKRLASESALTKRPPTEDERFLIHDLYLEYSKYDDPKAEKPDFEWMSDTKMSSIQIMQPQDHSQIIYSETGKAGEGKNQHCLQVRVKADVLDIEKNTRETTNYFWFTFKDPQHGQRTTPKVMPRTYAESMLYIEGMRRRNEGARLAQINRANVGL